MTTPLITWFCIVGLFVVILVVRLCHTLKTYTKRKNHIFGFMTEREEFFVPGDPDPRNTDITDLDEFDN